MTVRQCRTTVRTSLNYVPAASLDSHDPDTHQGDNSSADRVARRKAETANCCQTYYHYGAPDE